MPHTTTKAIRRKRVDTRPNGDRRKNWGKKIEDLKKIQDLRVTKVQKSERKPREAQKTEMKTKTEHEKYIRSIKKKMKAIDDLLQKQKNGSVLDPQQQAKVDTLGEVLAELEKAVDLSAQEDSKE